MQRAQLMSDIGGISAYCNIKEFTEQHLSVTHTVSLHTLAKFKIFFFAIFQRIWMITLFVFLSLMVTTWVKPFVIIQLCLLFSNHNKSRNYRNIPNQKFTCPSFEYHVLLQLPQWQLGVSWGRCGWGYWNYLMVMLPILLGKGPLVPINSWAVLYELHTGDNSMLLRSGDRYGHSRTFTSLFCSHWQVDLALCFGVFSMLEYPSTSHAKLQPWQVQNSQYYFW